METREYSIDLIKQMAECDANYIRLLKLLPQLRACRNKTLVKKAFYKEQSKIQAKALLKEQGKAKANNEKNSKASNKIKGKLSAQKKKVAQTKEPNEKSNYAPLLGRIAEFFISDAEQDGQRTVVEIRVLESFKYTTTLEIIQKPEIGKWVANPCMHVRVYHDASTAEVISYQSHRNFKPKYPQPNSKMYQVDEKMQVNKFLGEWLTHCLAAGRCELAPDLIFS